MSDRILHFDDAETERAIASIEAAQHPHAPGIDGMQARFNLAVLRPFILAMMREINAGATNDQLSKVTAGVVTNLVLTIADSASNQAEPLRSLEIGRLLLRIGAYISQARESSEIVASVLGQAGGRA